MDLGQYWEPFTQQFLNQLLFAVLPYVAAIAFVVLVIARRYRLPPFGAARRSEGAAVRPHSTAERVLFGYGLLAILAGHALAFMIPKQVQDWNAERLRLYILEASGLAFALMTLTGLVFIMIRRGTDPEARRGTHLADWILYVLLLVEVANGILVAVLYWRGSEVYAVSAVPYLRSLVKLDPDIRYIVPLPHAIKLHIVTAFVLLGFLPFTRLVRPLVESERDRDAGGLGSPVISTLLLIGLGVSLAALAPRMATAHLPGNDQGYEPIQPVAFSHRLHAGDVQISCLYCHSAAEKSRHAGIPAADLCMNCHRTVTAPVEAVRYEQQMAELEHRPIRPIIAPELKGLYVAQGLNVDEPSKFLQRDPALVPAPIEWVKVHNLPAFTYFDHRAHVHAGVTCQSCHGPVETMERIRQVSELSMGWCVQCHRDPKKSGPTVTSASASNDCSTCHH